MIERIGKYGILERVGVGGQGTVYRAQDPDLNRIVALKVMNQAVSIDGEYIDALRNEAQIAARLAHPNIATVYDFLIENDQACIVMEYVPGSLNLLLLEQKNIPIERVIEITIRQQQGYVTFINSYAPHAKVPELEKSKFWKHITG